ATGCPPERGRGERRVGPDVPQAGDGVGVQEQPEPLTRLDRRRQERVYDAEGLLARADRLRVAAPDEPDVLSGLQKLGRRHRRHRDVQGVAPAVAILDELAELRSVRHLAPPGPIIPARPPRGFHYPAHPDIRILVIRTLPRPTQEESAASWTPRPSSCA